jgi:hypothetical protein
MYTNKVKEDLDCGIRVAFKYLEANGNCALSMQ